LSERLNKIFSKKTPKTKLVAYFVGCYPTFQTSLDVIKEAIDNGVSILEIGFATSEASAEGKIIKTAHDHVLNNNDTLLDVIKLVKEIRNYNQDVGIILMGYIANLYKHPIPKFVEEITEAGADGCLVVDAPHELKEENILRNELNNKGLSLIKLVAPTTNETRLKEIIKISSGFLYQVNLSGVTGEKSAHQGDVNTLIKNIRAITSLPVCSGFGIKTPSDAKDIAKTGCDAIVVGSTYVKYIQENIDDKKLPQNVGKLIKSFTNELE
jgi:tryptophan synthase alpha chain